MATSTKKAIKISQKHLLGIQDLSISDIKLILSESKNLYHSIEARIKKLTF